MLEHLSVHGPHCASFDAPTWARTCVDGAVDSLCDVSVLAFDAEMRIVAARGGAAARHGYEPDRMMGRRAPDVLPAEVWEHLGPLYVQALAGRTAAGRIATLDRSAIYETTFSPVFDGDQVVGGVATSIKLAEPPPTDDGWRGVLERSFVDGPVGMLIVRAGVILRANEEVARLAGVDAEALVGRAAVSLVHPDERDAAARALERAARGEVVGPAYRRVIGRGEETRTVRIRYSVLGEQNGQTAVLLHLVDRTREVRAEADAKRALDVFSASFERAPIGMCLVGLDGRFLRVNEALCEVFARPREVLLASDFQRLTHPEDLAADLDLLDETLTGVRDGYELGKRYLRPDGSVVEARLSVSLVRTPQGAPDYFVSQIVDVTELEAARRGLEHLADHDPLTGLSNRRAFERELGRALAGGRVGVLLIDLDGFKAVNDTLGHDAGDELLIVLARTFSETLPESATLARLGGDEFAVAIPGASDHETLHAAELISAAADSDGHVSRGASRCGVGASVGTAHSMRGSASVAALLRDADAEMYAVKQLRSRTPARRRPRPAACASSQSQWSVSVGGPKVAWDQAQLTFAASGHSLQARVPYTGTISLAQRREAATALRERLVDGKAVRALTIRLDATHLEVAAAGASKAISAIEHSLVRIAKEVWHASSNPDARLKTAATRWVTPTDSGRWIVKTEASGPPGTIHQTQRDAIRHATRLLVQAGGGQLTIIDPRGEEHTSQVPVPTPSPPLR